MKALVCSLTCLLLAAPAAARAEGITITLDQPTQTLAAGNTVAFFGTITNVSTGTIFLNNDDLDFSAPGLSTTDQFFSTVPLSLGAGTTSGDIELFDITASSLFTTGTAAGTYTLFGGTTGDAQDNLASASFAVDAAPTASPVPEPASLLLLLTGAAAATPTLGSRLRRRSTTR